MTWILSTASTTVPTIPVPYTTAGTGGTIGDKTIAGPARKAAVSTLLDALSAAQRATVTPDHMSRLVARAQLGPVVLGDPKVARAATDMSITPDAWFTLAGV